VLRKFDERSGELFRYLRATESEFGDIDAAAKAEMKQERKFCYYSYDTTCLVENDEEPPAPLNLEALEICCTIARALSMTPINQIHTMRKLVIDGSNTPGFQRTALVALDGILPNGGSIETICLEEEAAQRVEGNTFSLDRLGIPLVEITTSPCMKTPEEVRDIAAFLGMVLRSTGQVRRGLGTIRQDVNISIRDGARVEIKGVQELDLIADVVKREVLRQRNLLEIREQLKGRGASVIEEMFDVSGIFRNSKSTILKRSSSILAVRLPSFAGLVGREIQPGRRLGSEFSDYAKKCGVGGIFHTDELPAYGITEEEIAEMRAFLESNDDECIVIVAADEGKARCAAQQVIARAGWALRGIPEETRKMIDEGSTAYMRPLPGAARMYPETDVAPVTIPTDWFAALPLPELLTAKRERFIREYLLDPALATQLVSSEQAFFFEQMVTEGISPGLAARTLLSTIRELSRAGTDIQHLTEKDIIAVLMAVERGEAAKEAIPAILCMVVSGASVPDALRHCAPSLSRDALISIVQKIVDERKDFIAERGNGALGPLMGVVMAEVRGSVDGKLVSEVLRQEISALLARQKPGKGDKV
jgi:glutamyl-tRNA(Gln) amidotransferase subunit E